MDGTGSGERVSLECRKFKGVQSAADECDDFHIFNIFSCAPISFHLAGILTWNVRTSGLKSSKKCSVDWVTFSPFSRLSTLSAVEMMHTLQSCWASVEVITNWVRRAAEHINPVSVSECGRKMEICNSPNLEWSPFSPMATFHTHSCAEFIFQNRSGCSLLGCCASACI